MSADQSTLRTLLIQPELRWQNPAENRAQLEALIRQAVNEQAADLIFVPETFTTGFLGDENREPESMDGDTVEWMRQQAAAHDAAIGGSVIIGEGIGEDSKRFNRFLFVSPDGRVEHYDKRHLFAYQGEHRRYTAGSERVVVPYRGWRICLQVCYDLRFPVWCRNRDDYDLLVFVANWPSKRVNAWLSLLKARAIENQSFAIGVNRVGRDGRGLEYPGQSVVYGPLGDELACLGSQVATASVVLDLEHLRRIREELPFLMDADAFEIMGSDQN